MATDMRKARAEKLAQAKTQKYGALSAIAGRSNIKKRYYSSGSPTLDYMLGTDGLPDNSFVEVFGPPGIGKTTIYGFGILRSVQAAGGLTAVIATEPDFDEDWMERHGVNPDYNVVFRPDTGEEAWELLRDLVFDKDVDYVLWDSLGGTSSAKEQKAEVPIAFGNANMNSWGIRNVAVRAWKNRVGVMFINQVRDDAKAKIPTLKSPGGYAVEHLMKIRIQAKPGKNRYEISVPAAGGGSEKLLVGREVRSVIAKNKAAEGLGKQAVFDFYHVETDEYPFGFDREGDLVNVARLAGVVTGTGWLSHPVLPGGKLNGKPALIEHLRRHPEAFDKIRADVTEAMRLREAELAAKKRNAKKEAKAK
jgi:RecA/RadA recombinase